jgi:serine/threonine-protein kinase
MASFDRSSIVSIPTLTRSVGAGPLLAPACAPGVEDLVGTTLGVYRLDAALGCGSVGVVYRAWDRRAGRAVAVKVLRAGLLASPADRRRFKMEALALGRLSHPNVTAILDFGTAFGRDYLVMEFVAGETLADLLDGQPMASGHVAFLGEQLAYGLEAAHRAGFVHRDIKPQNLRLTPEGRLKILDFGLACAAEPITALDADATVDSGVRGTVPYMAPEQLSGDLVDARTDIYGAGTVLYELACGRRPFDALAMETLIHDIKTQRPRPPSALNPAIWPSLESVILRTLAKDPDDRMRSAHELARELTRVSAPPTRGTIRALVNRWRRVPAGVGSLLESLGWE